MPAERLAHHSPRNPSSLTAASGGEQRAGRLLGRLVGRLVGWLLGRLVGWLVGRLVNVSKKRYHFGGPVDVIVRGQAAPRHSSMGVAQQQTPISLNKSLGNLKR